MSNEFLPFSADVSANVLTQSAYAGDSQRLTGNQPGIARAQLVNKAIRQATVMVAGIGQFIANRQVNNMTDSLSSTQVENYLKDSLVSRISVLPAMVGLSPGAWWRKSPIDGYIEQGLSGIVLPSGGVPVNVTFPLAFSTVVLDVQVGVNPAATQMCGWSDPTLTQVTLQTGNLDTLSRTVNIIVRGY